MREAEWRGRSDFYWRWPEGRIRGGRGGGANAFEMIPADIETFVEFRTLYKNRILMNWIGIDSFTPVSPIQLLM